MLASLNVHHPTKVDLGLSAATAATRVAAIGTGLTSSALLGAGVGTGG